MNRKYRKCFLYFFMLFSYGSLSILYLQNNIENEIYSEAPDWQHRLHRIQKVCNSTASPLLAKPKQLQRENLSPGIEKHFTKIYQKDILLNLVRITALKLDWCLVPKVSSTSLSKLILEYLPKLPNHSKPSPFLQKEVWVRAGHLTSWDQYKSQNFNRFFISRHPFARIASAFRNKLEDRTRSHDGNYFFSTYSTQIIRLSRGSVHPDSPEPSFQEFIDYLLATPVENYDEHWQPVSLRCRVCQLDYSHVLQYENLGVDWQFFLQDAGLPNDLVLPWENKGALPGALKDYFGNITRSQQEKLAEKLAADFAMFGYSLEDDF